MIIEQADIGDFLEIAQFDRIAWKDNSEAQFIPDGEHAWRVWVEYAVVFCAKDNQKIIGVLLAFPTNNNHLYFLHKLFVDNEYRNKGTGKKLFKPFCDLLDEKNFDCILTTSPNNHRMIHLCEKFGFKEKVLIKSYYRVTEDRFLIKRKAKEA